MTVWVDGWGKVRLDERNLGVSDVRYYTCVGKGGVELGWLRLPVSATLMRSHGGGRPAERRSQDSASL